MTLPVEKMRKTFLLMLRATVAGEAIAAREAFLRIAKAEGYGPHELTDALVAGTHKVNGANDRELSANEIARRCWDHFEIGELLLSEKERKFVLDMIDWGRPSEKQIAWLKKIYARVAIL